MKVFLALKPDYDNDTIYGVFSTLELAQAACGESTAEWEQEKPGDCWYRPEVDSGRLRVESSHGIGWYPTHRTIADPGYVQALDLDTPVTTPTRHELPADSRPMTEQDEAEWKAYIFQEQAAGRVVSTTTVNIHSTG